MDTLKKKKTITMKTTDKTHPRMQSQRIKMKKKIVVKDSEKK